MFLGLVLLCLILPQAAQAAAPVADDQALITNEDTSINITLTASDADGDAPLLFGATGWGTGGAPTYFYNGLIDDVMIFNRALSAGEIQNIYNSQKPVGMATMEETKLKGLASILSAIQEILEKIKNLF